MKRSKGSAITKALFKIGGRAGTQVCSTTFLVALGFIFTACVALLATIFDWYGFNRYTRSTYRLVILNAPESLMEYQQDEYPDYGDYIFTDTWDAPYDFLHMSDLLHEHSAGLAVYFPENFDDLLRSGKSAEVLVYYRTDTLDYKDISAYFIDNMLEGYKERLGQEFNITDMSESKWEVIRDDIPTDNLPSYVRFARRMGNTFVPILLFIAILYSAMASGTEAISGQKERGTFSRILLTPVPRKDIAISFIRGVFTSAVIPALVISSVVLFIPAYSYPMSIPALLILIGSLTLFVASLTVMISVMNESVSSAQTAFLPIFFILISVTVTCINGDSEENALYYYLPIYGHFYGLGDAFNGQSDIIAALVCSVITTAISAGIIAVCTKLLKTERFTVAVPGSDDRKQNLNSPVSGFTNKLFSLFDIIVFPLATLSIFQLIAMIPVIVAYMADPSYSDFIAELRFVSGVGDIIKKTIEIVNIFMGDPRFLALMTVSYFLIIITYIIRAGGTANIGLSKKGFVKKYILGIFMGILMMTAVFTALIFTGRVTVNGKGLTSENIMVFLFSVLMWIPQGASEEIMFRGFMIPKIKKIFNTPAAIIISSVLFSAFHSFNAGFTWLAFVNIFLLAVLFALIYIRSGSIVITCAAHTMWNMFQGNIYGLAVSGNTSVAAVIDTTYKASSFGPEGTTEATAVILLSFAVFGIISLCKKRSSQKAS